MRREVWSAMETHKQESSLKQPENNDAAADDLTTPDNLDTASAADTGTNNVDEENAGENKPLLLTEPREDTVAIQHPDDGQVYHVPFDDLTHFQTTPARAGQSKFSHRMGNILRSDSIGGILLIIAAIAAVTVANTPLQDWYYAVRDSHFVVPLGFTTIDMSIGHWASDGLLAVFFFVVGLELKTEFVTGGLRNFKHALPPMAAAFGGVAVPALIYLLVNIGQPASTMHGWAIPAATDIAFAVAVLAVVGAWLPTPAKLFLLTLAVVDDLIAIIIIAVFYSSDISFMWLGLSLVPIAIYGTLAQLFPNFFRRQNWAPWIILLGLGFLAWVFMLNSGIHATIAGVLLGFTVPAKVKKGHRGIPLTEVLAHRVGPFSTGLAVPVFAFFAAGVTIAGMDAFKTAMTDTVVWGIILGLVVGKPLGIMGATWLITRTPAAELDPKIKWGDLLGVTMVAGIGFTVALLVAELSFGVESLHGEDAKIAILLASVLAAVLASIWLAPRNRRYKQEAQAKQASERSQVKY